MLNQKGQIRIVEAFLSIALVFSAILASANFPSSPDLSRQQSLISIGTQTLVKLDSDGTLSNLILQQNWVAVKQILDAMLPLGVSYNLTVFDEEMRQANSQFVQNSDILGRETVSVQYICVSQTPNVRFFLLRLQLGWAR